MQLRKLLTLFTSRYLEETIGFNQDELRTLNLQYCHLGVSEIGACAFCNEKECLVCHAFATSNVIQSVIAHL